MVAGCGGKVSQLQTETTGSKLQDWYCSLQSTDHWITAGRFPERTGREASKRGDNLKLEVKNAMADTATNARIMILLCLIIWI